MISFYRRRYVNLNWLRSNKPWNLQYKLEILISFYASNVRTTHESGNVNKFVWDFSSRSFSTGFQRQLTQGDREVDFRAHDDWSTPMQLRAHSSNARCNFFHAPDYDQLLISYKQLITVIEMSEKQQFI